MITLPIYLQKYIIKKLCIHINYYNGLMDIQGIFDDYRKDEKEIKILMMTIALVSKEWFKTLSNNLTIAVDFNYKEKGKDQYSIIKSDNIETLKIHFNHQPQQFYEMVSGGFPIEIPIEIVNDKIMKLSTMEGTNFKYLILRNVNQDSDIDIIDKLYQCKQTNDHSVAICEFTLTYNSNIEQINHLKEKVFKIFTLLIKKTPNFQVLLETLKQWSNDLHHLLVIDSFGSYSIIERFSSYHNGSGNRGGGGGEKKNYLSNIKLCSYSPISISELDILFKSSPKLNYVSFGICLGNFLYYLSKEIEQEQQQEQQQQKLEQFPQNVSLPNCFRNKRNYSPMECICNTLFSSEQYDVNLMTENEKSIKFNNHFSSIIKNLQENKNTINQLRIYNFCYLNFPNTGIFREVFNIESELIGRFVSFIASFKSLKVFEASFFNLELFHQIVIKNPSITHYRITIPKDIIAYELAIDYSNKILLNNPHIMEFQIN
ncbi:hypothetical protein ACTFIV_011239 [Dictyostelium citrinum]